MVKIKPNIWDNKFGTDYTNRNVVSDEDIESRKVMWANILTNIAASNNGILPSSILEIGCGSGRNLIAIKELYNSSLSTITLKGIEPNELAYNTAKSFGYSIINSKWEDVQLKEPYELVFTSGVLIHTSKNNLKRFMDKIISSSTKYIVCIEYFSAERRMIPYRGMDNELWTDDYGSLYLDNYKLRCVGYGFMWKRIHGLDNLTYWIMEKVN